MIAAYKGWLIPEKGTIDRATALTGAFEMRDADSLRPVRYFSAAPGTEPGEAVYDGRHIFYLGQVSDDDSGEKHSGLLLLDEGDPSATQMIVDIAHTTDEVWENLQLAEDGNPERAEAVLTWDRRTDSADSDAVPMQHKVTTFKGTLRMYRVDTVKKTPHLMNWNGNLYWFAEKENVTLLQKMNIETGEKGEIHLPAAYLGAQKISQSNSSSRISNGLIGWISEGQDEILRMDLQKEKIIDKLSVKGLTPDYVQCSRDNLLCTDSGGNTWAYSIPSDQTYYLGTASPSETGWQAYLRGNLVWVVSGNQVRCFDLTDMTVTFADAEDMGLDSFSGTYANRDGVLLAWKPGGWPVLPAALIHSAPPNGLQKRLETQSSTHCGRLLPVCRTFCELFSTFGGERQLVANDFRLFFAKSVCPAHFWRVFGKNGRLVFDT